MAIDPRAFTPMGLESLFSDRPSSGAQIARLPGGLPAAVSASHGEPNATQPAGIAPSLSPGQSVDTSLTNMAINAVQGNPLSQTNPGLFSGNFTGQGVVNTALSGLAGLFGGAIPGFTMANLVSGLMGPLSTFATNRGHFGGDTSGMEGLTEAEIAALTNTTSGRAADAIAQGLGISGGRLASMNAEAPFGQPPSLRGDTGRITLSDYGRGRGSDEPDPDAAPTPDPSNENEGAIGTGPGGVGPGSDGNTSDGTGSGNTGGVGDGPAWHRGGTVRGKRGQEVRGRLKAGEEVIRESEADRPGVRAALKTINRPGVSGLERLLMERR